MGYSPLAARVVKTRQKSSRNGATVDTVLWHHQAGTNSESVLAAMASGSRQVSSNYVVTNEGEVVGVVDEAERAWTSGSATDGGRGASWDRRSITVEVENESANGWTISAAAYAACAALAADLDRRHPGIDLSRSDHLGHRELWTGYRASYPTACPGGLDIDKLLAAARGGAAVTPPASPSPTLPAPAFPLPLGAYFGPKSGPAASVSGYYSHRDDLRRWQRRMAERGWTIDADGLYGNQTAKVALDFQAEKGLLIDGKIGPSTWAAAWTLPVT